METLLAKVVELGEKAEYLNQKSQTLVVENRALHGRIAELEGKVAQQQLELARLSEINELARLARQVEHRDEAANEELKRKINDYIREIDQCLKLIGD